MREDWISRCCVAIAWNMGVNPAIGHNEICCGCCHDSCWHQKWRTEQAPPHKDDNNYSYYYSHPVWIPWTFPSPNIPSHHSNSTTHDRSDDSHSNAVDKICSVWHHGQLCYDHTPQAFLTVIEARAGPNDGGGAESKAYNQYMKCIDSFGACEPSYDLQQDVAARASSTTVWRSH